MPYKIIYFITNQIFLKMQENQPKTKFAVGKAIRILPDPLTLSIKDQQTNIIFHMQLIDIPPNAPKNGYYHILKQLVDGEISYQIIQTNNKKSKPKICKNQLYKGRIYFRQKNIISYLSQQHIASTIKQCTDESIYNKDEILECYVMKVECLKLKLYLLDFNNCITFYFTEFRLPKVSNIHPKDVWHKCQEYFNREIEGDFVQVKINGSENYRDQLNIHGEICRLYNGADLKELFLKDGYVDLSKNCQKYLNKKKIEHYEQIITSSKKQMEGLWKQEQQTIIKLGKAKNNPIFQQQKYNKWEQWHRKKYKFSDIKNNEQQFRAMLQELKQNTGAKADPSKNRIILQTAVTLLEDCMNDKHIVLLEDLVRICASILSNLQMSIGLQAENLEFLKYLNKIMIVFLFYLQENQKIPQKANINKGLVTQIEKSLKVIFKCCFLGNQTFHKRVFHKNVESQFQKFSYDPAYLSGISSYSEYSDYEQSDKVKGSSKLHKKIASGQVKIRMNSTLLLSMIFKTYSSIVENHWQICVNSNILTEDFNNYLHKLKISIQQIKMSPEDIKKIAALMRTNFGDYSMILLVFFEQNAKVKINALNCLINMIGNFQGKKMIDTTEAVYIEKLLKQTKSSFIPKSYIIFSGLRNALYFMLFSLHHEKNIVIIINTFKALTQLCQQSTLIDKMGFMQGMGLLLSHYIIPVLKFPWQITELTQLKMLCVSFLGALVNSQKKWEEVENQYLMKEGEENINYCMMQVLEDKKKVYLNPNSHKDFQNDKIIVEITKYFMKMAKRYYPAVFFQVVPNKSVWICVSELYLENSAHNFTKFVQQVFKCHYDNVTIMKSHSVTSRKVIDAVEKAENIFGTFLSQFLPKYSQIVTNENYISLINILTYISYQKWSDKSYETAKQFLLHCFHNVNGKSQSKTFPSIQSIKNNSLVRLALIKLLGYLSFCKQFQKAQYSTIAVRNLLKYSQNYKSLNSVVKITWGISNWSNIQCFKDGLKEEQMKECLDYMIHHSHSEKQKIASNCTRGIGFFIKNLNKNFDVEKCREAVIKNLSHLIIKVRTNSTKTLRAMVANNLFYRQKEEKGASFQDLISILEQNILKNNYHLQTETLLLIKQLGSPIKPSKMLSIYGHILKDLSNHTTMQYEFSQIKTLKQLRRNIIQQIVNMPSYQQIKANEVVAKQFYQSVENYILDEREQSLRKKAHESEILERGFQKGQEALNAVFNIKKQKYDEEKTIATQFTLSALEYEPNNEEDLQLLRRIKGIGTQLKQLGEQWKYLSEMSIKDKKICLGRN